GRDIDASRKSDRVGHEATKKRAIGAREDLDMWSASGTRAGDDIGLAIPVDIADRHASASSKETRVGVEASQNRKAAAAPDGALRPAAGIGAGDEVIDAIAADVAHGHKDTSAERGRVGVKLVK